MRYPLQPLLDAAGLTLAGLNDRIPMGGQTYKRARAEGLSELVADRWATRLGLHPAEVWPEFMDAAIEEVTRECEAHGCSERFLLSHHARRFCSPRCRSREGSRRRYRNPETAAQIREQNAAYRAESRRVKRMKDAQYRARNRPALRAKQRQRDRARRAFSPRSSQGARETVAA